jgi:hypothetical protein
MLEALDYHACGTFSFIIGGGKAPCQITCIGSATANPAPPATSRKPASPPSWVSAITRSRRRSFLQRQPECRTDQPRCPARDQRQRDEREKTAGLFFGPDVRVRAGLHRGGPNLSERNDLANEPAGARRAPKVALALLQGLPSGVWTRDFDTRPGSDMRARCEPASAANSNLGATRPLTRCGSLIAQARYANRDGQAQGCVVRLAVDQNEVWPNVAVAVIAPLAAERMIKIPPRQWLILRQHPHGCH